MIVLILFLYLWSSTSAISQGGCLENGIFLNNGTSWFPEPCTQCQCHSFVTACSKVQCHVPECSPEEELISLPQECCARCLIRMKSCVERDLQFEHGASWPLSPCFDCQCYNGTISCERKYCQMTGCLKNQVEVQTAESCCPQCVSIGRRCKVGSQSYADGAIWSSLNCSKCSCHDGIVQCYVAQCPSISCPLNHTLESLPGKCCPICHGNPCFFNGKVHSSETRWKENACTHCSCNAEKVNCYEMKCPQISCPIGRQLYYDNATEQCCPSCVDKEGWCTLPTGVKIPPGTQVEIPKKKCDSKEEIDCVCTAGTVLCKTIHCQKSNCGIGMILQNDTNSASFQCKCPKCVPDMNICYFDRRPRKDGETWLSGCRMCGCTKGEVTCYNPVCPTCPEGYQSSWGHNSIQSLLPNSLASCCPKCLMTAPCPKNCLSCTLLPIERNTLGRHQMAYPSVGSSTCKDCRNGYLLQEGKCVKACDRDMIETSSSRCIPCHPTCATCTDSTHLHCSSCPSSLYLLNGGCKIDCGAGYYPHNGDCQKCHESCEECAGSEVTDCQVCHRDAKLFNGLCVDMCPPQYVARDGVCEMIPSNCDVYGTKGECLKCEDGFVNQMGKCLSECEHYFFLGPSNVCEPCHSSCATCDNWNIASCTSCPHYLLQVETMCLPSCPSALFQEGNRCIPCHENCSECVDEGSDNCSSCQERFVLLPRDLKNVRHISNSNYENEINHPVTDVGTCVEICPENYQNVDGHCLGFPKGCKDWLSIDMNHCKKCKDGFLMENSMCVQQCSPGYYKSDSYCLGKTSKCVDILFSEDK